ncbi:MAG TPA: DUF4345 domain-containing protein [Allosphingosinicella sp.]|jgi:hypothetical protein
MNLHFQRRLLQAAVAAACIVPLATGTLSLAEGPAFIRGVEGPVPVDLDSHFRYLSGLLLGLGLAFASCIPRIERRTGPFQALGFIVVVGALGRLLSLLLAGTPGTGHLFGLAMELAVVPLLMLWQRRVAASYGRTTSTSG